jgi:DNA-binding NtrC family response regulator
MARILVVDDDTNMRRVLSAILEQDDHSVSEASTASEAIAMLASSQFDAAITDYKMASGDGLSVIAAAKDSDPTLPVVMLTAYATVELAVEAMRHGAFDFISKPFVPEVVRSVSQRAYEHAKLLRENERLKGEIQRLGFDNDILGDSEAIQELKVKIRRVAPTNATVLITGETGTGKELVARAIHKGSLRSKETFVAVNCAAFTETLLESELFGHERGAFTGADRSRQGLFEAANRGILFLDEAGEMSLPLQARLLRVLTDGQVLRVGSTTPRRVDVRIIAATHRDLPDRVREGLFREDLYYRLAVVPIAIPPLRERRQDIPVLIEHLMKQAARELKVSLRPISAEAVRKLASYDFPGNVRELRNLVERAYILARGEEFKPEDFPIAEGAPSHLRAASEPNSSRGLIDWFEALPSNIDLRKTVESMERDLILRALQAAAGVQAEAARSLGVSRSDLSYKIRKYGLEEALPD